MQYVRISPWKLFFELYDNKMHDLWLYKQGAHPAEKEVDVDFWF